MLFRGVISAAWTSSESGHQTARGWLVAPGKDASCRVSTKLSSPSTAVSSHWPYISQKRPSVEAGLSRPCPCSDCLRGSEVYICNSPGFGRTNHTLLSVESCPRPRHGIRTETRMKRWSKNRNERNHGRVREKQPSQPRLSSFPSTGPIMNSALPPDNPNVSPCT